MNIFVVVRAVIYAAVFVGFVLVYLPSRFLSWSGIVPPATTGAPQVAGMILVTVGTAIALWRVFTFVFIGKGTPEAKYELRSKTNQEARKSGKISSCNHEWTRTHTNVRHGFASTDYADLAAA